MVCVGKLATWCWHYTLVSPLNYFCRRAPAPAWQHRWGGLGLGAHGQKAYLPEFADARRCRLVVLGLEVGGRWSAETFSGCSRGLGRAVPPPPSALRVLPPLSHGGL